MPAHPTFDSATLDALQTYFKTVTRWLSQRLNNAGSIDNARER